MAKISKRELLTSLFFFPHRPLAVPPPSHTMGANESRQRQQESEDGTGAGQDYYAILEVDENATQDEIRVSIQRLM